MNEQNKTMNNPRPATTNADPITGTPGAHPVGVGVGAATGAAAGAVTGAIAGPVGAVAGAAVGAVAGGIVGKGAAEVVNPTVETKYWKDNFASRPYATNAANFDAFAPAYRYGWESFDQNGGKGQTFESVEGDLGRGWDRFKGQSSMAWNDAKAATKDAWTRVHTAAHTTCENKTV